MWKLAKPGEGMIHHQTGPSFDRLVAISTVAAQVKTGIINVKASIKTWCGAVERIKNQRSYKRSSLISMLVQYVWQIREVRR